MKIKLLVSNECFSFLFDRFFIQFTVLKNGYFDIFERPSLFPNLHNLIQI